MENLEGGKPQKLNKRKEIPTNEIREASITISGHQLTFAESMTLRVAISNFLLSLKKEGLGDDIVGIKIAENYKHHARNIQNYIMEEVR